MADDISHDRSGNSDAPTPDTAGQRPRQEAIEQIERRRRFRTRIAVGTVGMILLVVVWATSEYHNARGWPARGFSQSSGIPNVWNGWIIYPLVAWALFIAANAWLLYGQRPISESEIEREIKRQGER